MKHLIKIFILGAAIVSLTNCSKDKDKGNSISNNNSYYFSNGYCIRRADQQMVDPSFCNHNNGSGGNNGGSVSQYFRWQNNTCYVIDTNQQVDQAYCTTNPFVYTNNECIDTLQNVAVDNKYCQGTTNPNPGGGSGYPQPSGQCFGTFYYGQYPYIQYVQCYGYNCSGYTLNNFQTGMPQYCQ